MNGFDGECIKNEVDEKEQKQNALPHLYAGPLGMFTPPLEYKKQVAQNKTKNIQKSKKKEVNTFHNSKYTRLPPIDQSRKNICVTGASILK